MRKTEKEKEKLSLLKQKEKVINQTRKYIASFKKKLHFVAKNAFDIEVANRPIGSALLKICAKYFTEQQVEQIKQNLDLIDTIDSKIANIE